MDLLALTHKQDVAIAAQTGIARPFIARKDDERAVLIVFPGQMVQLVPERGRDLEIVPLMAHAVEECPVAGKLDQIACRVGADRLLGLAMQVAPV